MRNYKELLLVVVICGAILGVGMSAAKFGTEKWKNIKCQSNLKEIYKLADKYQAANNGNIVPVVDKTKRPWKWWCNYLTPYATNPHIFYCPANPKAAQFFVEEEDPLEPKTFGMTALSYGMNWALGEKTKKKTTIVNIKQIADPSYVVYFGDSNLPQLRGTKWCWKTDYAPRHFNKSNFVFMDGSVKLMNHENLGLCQNWKQWEKDRKRWFNWTSK